MTGEDLAGGVPHGQILSDLIEAVNAGDEAAMVPARQAIRAKLGAAAFVDACATIASFSAVVKIADGAGIPLEDYKEKASRELRDELSINAFQT